MTYNLNRITRFINSFSKTGRQANRKIKNMLKYPNSGMVYQKQFKDGSIALLQYQYFPRRRMSADIFCLIKSDGSKVSKITTNTISQNKTGTQRVYRSIAEFLDITGGRMKLINKSVLFRMPDGKIEEAAKQVSIPGGHFELNVYSAFNRISEFPSTSLGGRIHPAVATKSELPNGDVIYREYYPYS